MDFTAHYDSPIGGITMASDGTSLVGLWFDGQKHFADTLEKEYEEHPNLPVFDQTRHWLDLYFSGQQPDFTPLLTMRATPFRKAVWELLLTIPYGKTMTYGAVAKQIVETHQGTPLQFKSMSAQAVGGAVGHNSISLIIPCHRVVGSNGSLTGYAAGLDKKLWLLEMEK